MAQEALELEQSNPFRKAEGDCGQCGAAGSRIFWCHVCERRLCWECFKEHRD